jgi:hypothetical protein
VVMLHNEYGFDLDQMDEELGMVHFCPFSGSNCGL